MVKKRLSRLNYRFICLSQLIVIIILTITLIISYLPSESSKLSSRYPNEQTVRNYITYSDAIIGLSEQQATKKLKSDGMRVAVAERNGKQYVFDAMRIMPPGIITAYLSINKPKSGKTNVYNVTFYGESAYFGYIDVLRRDGKKVARDYAEQHNLH